MKSLLLFLISSLLTIHFLVAQVINGKVSVKGSGDPVAFANVYFSGTLIGSITDVNGNFSIEFFEDGKYELIVSYVGYKDYITTVEYSKSTSFLEIELEPETIQLEDVYVTPDTTKRHENYETFKQLFLGESKDALKVEIKNPQDIFLYYDEVEGTLHAHAKEEIIIDNFLLGYRLVYKLKEFRADQRIGTLASFGIPRFIEMKPESKKEEKKWQRARLKAYKGSFGHFLKSFKHNTFFEEGFRVFELHRVFNQGRPDNDLIEKRIKLFENELAGVHTDSKIEKRSVRDSLKHWIDLKTMPMFSDSLGREIEENTLIKKDILAFQGYLRIVYLNENEDAAFVKNVRKTSMIVKSQTSIIYFSEPLRIYENGYFDAQKVHFEGYLGWSSKIANMLPFEYLPN